MPFHGTTPLVRTLLCTRNYCWRDSKRRCHRGAAVVRVLSWPMI